MSRSVPSVETFFGPAIFRAGTDAVSVADANAAVAVVGGLTVTGRIFSGRSLNAVDLNISGTATFATTAVSGLTITGGNLDLTHDSHTSRIVLGDPSDNYFKIGAPRGDPAGDLHIYDVTPGAEGRLLGWFRDSDSLYLGKPSTQVVTGGPGFHVGQLNAGILRTAVTTADYTLIGTNITDGAANARIVISGNTRAGTPLGPGSIEYVSTTATGQHSFLINNSSVFSLSATGASIAKALTVGAGATFSNTGYTASSWTRVTITNNVASNSQYIGFQNTANNTAAYIGLDGVGLFNYSQDSLVLAPPVGKPIIFYTGASRIERLRIADNGDLNISNAYCLINSTGATAYQINGGSTVGVFGYAQNAAQWFSNSAAGDYVIRASTNLRIGTGVARSTLDVLTTGAVNVNSGILNMTGTATNLISFPQVSVASPSVGTRSVGTKILYYPEVGASAADYATGIEPYGLWSSVPHAGCGFRWYAGSTRVASIEGNGNMTLAGSLTQTSAVNGEFGLSVRNTSNGTNAFSSLRINNDTALSAIMFMNSSTRSSDGGVNTWTMRNDAGAVKLQALGAKGLTVASTTGYITLDSGLQASDDIRIIPNPGASARVYMWNRGPGAWLMGQPSAADSDFVLTWNVGAAYTEQMRVTGAGAVSLPGSLTAGSIVSPTLEATDGISGNDTPLMYPPNGTRILPSQGWTTISGQPYGNGHWYCNSSSNYTDWPASRGFGLGGAWVSFDRYNGTTGAYTGGTVLTDALTNTNYTGEWVDVIWPQLRNVVSVTITQADSAPRTFIVWGARYPDPFYPVLIQATDVTWVTGVPQTFTLPKPGPYNRILIQGLTVSFTRLAFNFTFTVTTPQVTIGGDGEAYTSTMSAGLQVPGGVSVGKQVITGGDLTTPVATLHASGQYPPAALTGTTTTLSGQVYGNGTYIVSASSQIGWPLHPAFNMSYPTEEGWHSVEGTPANSYTAATGLYTGTTSTTVSDAAVLGEWLQLQSPVAFPLVSTLICPRNGYGVVRSPRSFVIAGSNNGTTWTTVYAQSRVQDWTSAGSKTFVINSSIGYAYYRLIVREVGNATSGGTGSTCCNVSEWQLFDKHMHVEITSTTEAAVPGVGALVIAGGVSIAKTTRMIGGLQMEAAGADAWGNYIAFNKSRAGGAIAVNDELGFFSWNATNSANPPAYMRGAYIIGNVDAVSATTVSAGLSFFTRDASGLEAARMRIAGSGAVSVGAAFTGGTKTILGQSYATNSTIPGQVNTASIGSYSYNTSTLNVISAMHNSGNAADTPYPILNMIKPGIHSQSNDSIATFNLRRFALGGTNANTELSLGLCSTAPAANTDTNATVMTWRADGSTIVNGNLTVGINATNVQPIAIGISAPSSATAATCLIDSQNTASNTRWGLFHAASAGTANLTNGSLGFYSYTAGAHVVQIKPNGDLVTTASLTIGDTHGIRLAAADGAVITKSFDTFSSGKFSGLGRWGLFLEPSWLTLGAANLAPAGARGVQIVAYNADSTHSVLFRVATDTGATTIAGGALNLTNATSNIINWTNAGVAAPSFTTRSQGTKMVLYSQLSATAVDYAIGLEGYNQWYSVPDTNPQHGFKWYAGVTCQAQLSADGRYRLGNALTASTPTGDARMNIQDYASNVLSFYVSAVKVGGITTNNGAGTTSYNSTSDYRLKENLKKLDGKEACERLQQLPVYRFNFKADADKRTVDGFLAHEASHIVPEAVTGEKDGVDGKGELLPQMLDPGKLVPLLTASLQEALRRIDSLEKRLGSDSTAQG